MHIAHNIATATKGTPMNSLFRASLIVWSSQREGVTATLSIEAIHTVGAVVDSRPRVAGNLFSV